MNQNILIKITLLLSSFLFPLNLILEGWIDLETGLSAFVLILTACIVWFYTSASERSNELKLMPSVDVNINYSDEESKTFFWFSNFDKFPARVKVEVEVDNKRKNIFKNLYLSPNLEGKKTSNQYNLWEESPPPNCKEVKLFVTVKSAIKGVNESIQFKKEYKFNRSELRWDEKTWNYPDRRFPNITLKTGALLSISEKLEEIKEKIDN